MKKPQYRDEPKYLTVLADGDYVGLTKGNSVSTTIYKDEVYRCSYNDKGNTSVDVILELPSGERAFTFFSGRFRFSYKNEVKLCKC